MERGSASEFACDRKAVAAHEARAELRDHEPGSAARFRERTAATDQSVVAKRVDDGSFASP
jgi:hypothetical protein